MNNIDKAKLLSEFVSLKLRNRVNHKWLPKYNCYCERFFNDTFDRDSANTINGVRVNVFCEDKESGYVYIRKWNDNHIKAMVSKNIIWKPKNE